MATSLSSFTRPALLERLTGDVQPQQPSTLGGLGDDATVVRYGSAAAVAISNTTLSEGIHFDFTYTPLQHLGYKAAVSAFTKLYAMNVAPSQLLLSLAVSAKFSIESLELLYQGVRIACEQYGADLAGNDVGSSLTGCHICATAIGQAAADRVVYRHTAQTGDLLCVSGDIGGAYMGMQVLEREKTLFEREGVQPSLEGYAYVIGRQLKPVARKDIIDFLASADIVPTAMIAVNDGLAAAVLSLCAASKAGCEIHHHKVPIADQTAQVAGEFQLEPMVAALNGGQDNELLFTVPVAAYDKLIGRADISIIGYIKEKDEGCFMVAGPNGHRIALRADITARDAT